MKIKTCQREMRTAFLGGFAGQLVSGVIWLVAAAVSVWLQPGWGMAVLFFGSMLSDVEMALAKSDLDIGRHYSELAPEESRGVFDLIDRELRLARSMILSIKEQDDLLDGEPTLQRSIRLRNPYVDPMSLLQVDLLKRWRATERQDEDLLEALLVTVNGIARGIQNTG